MSGAPFSSVTFMFRAFMNMDQSCEDLMDVYFCTSVVTSTWSVVIRVIH